MDTFIEYLNPSDWSLHVVNVDNEAVNEDWILVPEGENFAYVHSFRGYVYFSTNKLMFTNHLLVWKRHTKPEELPFIDDEPKSHNHYFKDVSDLNEIDVYQVLRLFNVTDPCLQHIVKKALCAGQRGHKDFETDLLNIRDTALRAIEIHGGDQ